MGEDGLEGGLANGADRFQEARLEPAAVLVRPFEVEVGGPGAAAVAEGEGVGAAAFEPDVDDVHDLFVVGRVAAFAEEAGGGAAIPGVGAFGAEGVDDPGDDGRVTEGFACAAVGEDGDGDAPGALAGDAPVGAAGDHGGDAVAAGFGDEGGFGDGVEGAGADVFGPVHADEPLGGGAVDDGRLAAPGVGVGMEEGAAGEEAAGGLEGVGDGGRGLEDVGACEEGDPGGVGAVV